MYNIRCVSPWYNRTGWLGVKHQLIYLITYSYTSRAAFIFMRAVSLTHPVLPSYLCVKFLLHIPCCLDFYARSFSYTSRAFFFSFLSGEFLLHIPYSFLFFFIREVFLHIQCWLNFYLGTFSYTSHAGFIFIGGVPQTRTMLALFLCG